MKLSQHLTFTQLADLAGNTAREGALADAFAHAAECPQCGAQLGRLTHLIGLMRADTSEDAPRDVLAAAVNIFRPRAADRPAGVVARIMAALSFDSLQQAAPAFGLRSAGATAAPAARHLMFSAGGHDLSLHIAPSGEAWAVAGQLLGEGLPSDGGEAVLHGEMGTTSAELNELCEFTLPPVASGSYTLFLRLNEMEIEVPSLDLRA